jgi:hypothetical protein
VGITTYLGAEGKRGQKQLQKALKKIPAGKQIMPAVSAKPPVLRNGSEESTKKNGHKSNKPERRGKKSEPA